MKLEDEVLANAGVDVFEELFKLIFTKLYDEMESGRDTRRHLVGISGEVLFTYLRLPLVCELMVLHTSATMYPAISESDLLALPIPIISAEVQVQVQDAVRQASQARRLANQLLIAAKHAVEIAIEVSESAALNFLDAAFTSESQ